MLVLSRKVGERILIGDNVVVTVLAVERGKLRLGFEAPRDVRITRKELLASGSWQRDTAEVQETALAGAAE